MTDKVLIGYICEKGNHPVLIGEDDYGVCGSHHYAALYVTAERLVHEDGTPYYGRGQDPDVQRVADLIEEAIRVRERVKG